MSTIVQVIIPFRDRGIDLRRGANLDVVQAWWYAHGFDPHIVDDGLDGDAPFNRHRAYNRAVAEHPGDVYIFTEADMLVHPDQIMAGVRLAREETGLVVPFNQYRYLSDTTTAWVRDQYHDDSPSTTASWWALPPTDLRSIFTVEPERTIGDGRSIGAVNIVSRETLDLTGGFTEATSGNWYDDRIIDEGFAALCGRPVRHVSGPAVHLYHLPGHDVDANGDAHLTEADRIATQRNKDLLRNMRYHIRMQRYSAVRELMQYRTDRKAAVR